MAATAAEASVLRNKFGLTETSLTDDDIAEIFTDVEDEYSSYGRRVQLAAAYLAVAEQLRNAAAAKVSYAEGDMRESLSDMFKALDKMVDDYEKKLEKAKNSDTAPNRIMQPKEIPSRVKSYPDS